jgi:uncharacterized protein YeaC (DUF1315 family)
MVVQGMLWEIIQRMYGVCEKGNWQGTKILSSEDKDVVPQVIYSTLVIYTKV